MPKPRIYLCRYRHPIVEDCISEYKNQYEKLAKQHIKLFNQQIVAEGREIEQEFWFLNKTIGKQTHIITHLQQDHYPVNDPAILEKLAAYLQSNVNPTGNFRRRGRDENKYE